MRLVTLLLFLPVGLASVAPGQADDLSRRLLSRSASATSGESVGPLKLQAREHATPMVETRVRASRLARRDAFTIQARKLTRRFPPSGGSPPNSKSPSKDEDSQQVHINELFSYSSGELSRGELSSFHEQEERSQQNSGETAREQANPQSDNLGEERETTLYQRPKNTVQFKIVTTGRHQNTSKDASQQNSPMKISNSPGPAPNRKLSSESSSSFTILPQTSNLSYANSPKSGDGNVSRQESVRKQPNESNQQKSPKYSLRRSNMSPGSPKSDRNQAPSNKSNPQQCLPIPKVFRDILQHGRRSQNSPPEQNEAPQIGSPTHQDAVATFSVQSAPQEARRGRKILNLIANGLKPIRELLPEDLHIGQCISGGCGVIAICTAVAFMIGAPILAYGSGVTSRQHGPRLSPAIAPTSAAPASSHGSLPLMLQSLPPPPFQNSKLKAESIDEEAQIVFNGRDYAWFPVIESYEEARRSIKMGAFTLEQWQSWDHTVKSFIMNQFKKWTDAYSKSKQKSSYPKMTRKGLQLRKTKIGSAGTKLGRKMRAQRRISGG